MGAARIFAGSTLRRQWRAVVVLSITAGLVGAVVLASLAGARRTSSAFERFGDETRTADLTIFVPELDPDGLAELRARPGVEAIALGRQLTADVDGKFASVGAPIDDGIGRAVDRPRLIAGRRARESRADEIAIPEPLAQASSLGIGDTLELTTYSPADVDLLANGEPVETATGPKVGLRVVGITRSPSDLSIEGQNGGLLFTTRGFFAEYGDEIGSFVPNVLRVRVTDDSALQRVVTEARRLFAGANDERFGVQPQSETEGGVQESLDVVSTALLVVALLALVVGAVVLALALGRFVDRSGADLSTLRALGFSRSERTLALALPVGLVAAGGSVLAVVAAWLASPLMPLGVAREAEPDLGLDIDPLVLGVGVVAVALVVFALGLFVAYLAVRREAGAFDDAAPSATALARGALVSALTPPLLIGTTMAVQRGAGRNAIPVRQAIVGAVVAIAGVVTVCGFGASLGAIDGTPSAYGYNWDSHLAVRPPAELDTDRPCSSFRTPITGDRAVAAAAAVCSVTIEVEGRALNGIGMLQLRGQIDATLLEGRAPRAADEIALGSGTLAAIDAELGDRVDVAGNAGEREYTVVGSVVLPALFAGDAANPQAIADGAVLTGRGIDPIFGDLSDNYPVVLRFRPGIDRAAAIDRFHELGEFRVGRLEALPLEVERLHQLDVLPWALGAFFAVVGVLGIGYAVVVSVQRRASELAILKTIGFRRAQVMQTVSTQAAVLGVIGLVVGIPVGILLGRLAWSQVGGSAGISADATDTVSVLAVALVALGTIAAVVLMALVPARRAARLRPAVVLRSE